VLAGFDCGALYLRDPAGLKSDNWPQSYDGLTTLKAEGLRSVLLVPLRHDENTVGLLQLGSRSPRKFAFDEIRFYETLGNYLAVATQR